MKRIFASLLILAAVFALCLPMTGARADKGDLNLSQLPGDDDMVDLMLGKADMVTLEGPVSDVLVANPAIVDVMAVKANQLYLVGSALGDTNIMVMDAGGNVLRRINVHVQLDTGKLEGMIGKLYPDEDVKVEALTNQVVLTGHVSTPAVSNAVMNLVGRYTGRVTNTTGPVDDTIVNMLTVAGEQQVMLKVKIIEASRSALKDLGLEPRFDGDNVIGGLGIAGGAIASGLGLTAPAQLGLLALNYDSGTFGQLSFLARALEEEGIVNTLAEPNLTAISGEQAGFLAGGEIPIPTEIDRNGNLIYEFRPFGVSLNFRPTVMSANRISMEMTTEVSSASYDDNLQLQGVTVPTFNVRRADTTVELPSGGTLMIAGLLQSDTVSSLTSIPGVNKVPVVGDLLKSDTFQRNESELVVMITPYLVRPFAQPAAVTPAAPIKTGAANLNDVPRLSMSDLGELPEEDAPPAQTKTAVAAATPRPRAPQAAPAQSPSAAARAPQPATPAEPERTKSALARTFESNINRTYNSRKVEAVMKDMGSFGYITD